MKNNIIKTNNKSSYCLKEFIEIEESEEEIYSTDGAVCPYCGYINTPDCDSYELYSDVTDEFQCNNCSKKFKVYVNISWSWETAKIEENK